MVTEQRFWLVNDYRAKIQVGQYLQQQRLWLTSVYRATILVGEGLQQQRFWLVRLQSKDFGWLMVTEQRFGLYCVQVSEVFGLLVTNIDSGCKGFGWFVASYNSAEYG